MDLTVHTSATRSDCELLPIRAAVDAGHARRSGRRAAERLGLDEERCHRVEVVCTELATNLLRHATDGAMIVAPTQGSLLLIAADRGPGLGDLRDAFTDGFSSDHGMGGGLGAVRRMSDEVRLDSAPGRGTVIAARFGPPPPADWAGLTTCHPAERVCGDAWWLAVHAHGWRAAVIDGLGHGPNAREATDQALECLTSDPLRPLEGLLPWIAGRLSGTRGVVMAVAEHETEAARLRWTGVGNISGVCVERRGGSSSLASTHGILGRQGRTPRVFGRTTRPDDRVVLHSDGLRAQWSPVPYGALWSGATELVAARLLWDQGRRTDDATVLVLGTAEVPA